MKTVNSLSGGKTSSYLAVHFPADYNVFSVVCINDKECTPKDPALLKYAQEKLSKFSNRYGEFIATAENDKTLQVMMDLEQYIGKRIDWVRGKSFDQIIDEHTRLPYATVRYCTVEMKLQPIFEYWFTQIGEQVDMRIGFRFDEFKRMERFFNNKQHPNFFKNPVSCKNYGNKSQKHENFNWRYCSFPLIEKGITKKDVNDFWQNKYINEGDLFNESKRIEFPAISNCVGCFHKNKSTIAAETELNFAKMLWFAKQEEKGKGTWMKDKTTYAELMNNYNLYAGEVLFEMKYLGQSCDSGGCTD